MLTFYLHPELKKQLSSFAACMQLQGECFREQKGRRTQRVIIGDKPYFIKQHTGIGWKEIFKNLIQLKLPIFSAKNEWQAIQRLQHLSILTPTIKAYGCRGLNPAGLQSFLLMEELTGMVSLEDLCRHWKTQPPSFSLKQALICRVASIAKTMHENGINHRDFYLCHFLLDLNHQEPLKVYLIDLHRAGLHKHLSSRWTIKDLAGLYFSSQDIGLTQRDYWRFMKHYRQRPLRDIIATEESFWLKIKKRGEKLYHEQAPAQ